jgi:hypothetical protein
MEIIYRPVFFLKNNFSETGFCLRPEIEISSVDWAQQSRLLPEDEERIQSPKRRF